MQFPKKWSRRTFLKGAGSLSVAKFAVSFPLQIPGAASRFAYVGSMPEGGKHGIQVFSTEGTTWKPEQFVPTTAPAHLCLHPEQNILYVANRIDQYDGLPRGTIEAYAVDSTSGKLAFLHRQKLSLSGTNPTQVAISPDRKFLAVAVSGGGAYNILSLDSNGIPKDISAIFKEVGNTISDDQQLSPQPRSIVFAPDHGCLLASDAGCSRISTFVVAEDLLSRKQRHDITPRSSPGAMVFHAAKSKLYIANESDGSLSAYEYAVSTGLHEGKLQRLEGKTSGHSSMAMHPAGKFLYYAFAQKNADTYGAIHAVDISSGDGKVIPIQTFMGTSIQDLAIDHGGEILFAVSAQQNAVIYSSIDQKSGRLSRPLPCARIENPVSLALKSS